MPGLQTANLDLPTTNLAQVATDEDTFARLLVALRRHLHQHPEVGLQEYDTHRFIRETLEAFGLTVQGPVAETGLFVEVGDDASGPHVGYRADMDALPTHDQKQTAYRSRTPEAAHLCGHDAHTAIAMGVALILKHHEDRLDGRVRIFFQPNEEGRPSGAPLMIRAGILNDLDAVYGVHVAPDLEVGQFGLIKGAATAASDRFDVHVRQQGSGHSARPHESVDTVWVASQIINAYYQLVGRLTDARNATVLTVCRMHGGGAHNVIPESVEFGGTLRSTHPEDRRRVRRQMHDTAERTASTYGAHADVDIEDGSPPVINDETLVDHVADTVRSLFGEQAVHSIPQASMGGEDFAEYLRHVPGVFVRVGTAAGPDTHFPLHHGRFDIDERPLAPTARLMATALQQHLARDLNLGKPAASAFALDR